jgi:hypothetical protein
MIKRLFIIASVILTMGLTLSSCCSREERVINRLESLCEEIEEIDMFDEEAYEKYKEELKDIQKDAEDCKFSQEQQAKLIRLSGRFVSSIATKLPMALMNNLGNGSSVIKDVVGVIDSMIGTFSSTPNTQATKERTITPKEMEESLDELNDALRNSTR